MVTGRSAHLRRLGGCEAPVALRLRGQQGEVSGRDRGGAGRSGKEGGDPGCGPSAPFAQLRWLEVVRVQNSGWSGSAVGLFRGITRLCGNAT